jgi:hypothetical protein
VSFPTSKDDFTRFWIRIRPNLINSRVKNNPVKFIPNSTISYSRFLISLIHIKK